MLIDLAVEKKGSMKGEDEEKLSNQHSQISTALKKVLNFHFTFFFLFNRAYIMEWCWDDPMI